jgi:hypothetical protein
VVEPALAVALAALAALAARAKAECPLVEP